MKILFTSDLHENMNAFESFSDHLINEEFDVGVISGDLGEYLFTLNDLRATPGVEEDDLLEELYDPEDTIEELDKRVVEYRKNKTTPLYKATKMKELELRKILRKSKKPIIIVPGNHDLSEWRSCQIIHNVHNKEFKYGKYTFLGYRFTNLEISPEKENRDIEKLKSKIVKDTILVTHAPPFGILDKSYRGVYSGSKEIRKLYDNDNIILHLFGHIHHSFGYQGKAANGAYHKGKRFIGIDLEKLLFKYVE